jgi:hypothetical protein
LLQSFGGWQAQLLRDEMRAMPRGGGGRRKEFRRLVLQKWDN